MSRNEFFIPVLISFCQDGIKQEQSELIRRSEKDACQEHRKLKTGDREVLHISWESKQLKMQRPSFNKVCLFWLTGVIFAWKTELNEPKSKQNELWANFEGFGYHDPVVWDEKYL